MVCGGIVVGDGSGEAGFRMNSLVTGVPVFMRSELDMFRDWRSMGRKLSAAVDGDNSKNYDVTCWNIRRTERDVSSGDDSYEEYVAGCHVDRAE